MPDETIRADSGKSASVVSVFVQRATLPSVAGQNVLASITNR